MKYLAIIYLHYFIYIIFIYDIIQAQQVSWKAFGVGTKSSPNWVFQI